MTDRPTFGDEALAAMSALAITAERLRRDGAGERVEAVDAMVAALRDGFPLDLATATTEASPLETAAGVMQYALDAGEAARQATTGVEHLRHIVRAHDAMVAWYRTAEVA